jgi:glycosyltransferase involved in cell wall biosynthesis
MPTTQRIGFDARYINDRYHGIGRYAFRLLEAMVMQAPERQFIVFTGREADSRFNIDTLMERENVVIRRGPWPLYWPQEQIKWPALLGKDSIDVFHTPYFVAPLLTRMSEFPVIITVHDLIFDRYPEYMPHRWARPYYRQLMTSGLNRAKKTIVVSNATATDLMKYYPIHSDKLVIIPEGVDPGFAPIEDHTYLDQVCRQYELKLPIILSVGVRRPHKNQVRLVRAFARLAERIPHDLVLVGQRDDRFPDEAQHAVKALELQDRVCFLEWVPEQELKALYNLADLVVLPSLIEGFGLPAIEAMACGTPVVAANNSSFPEVIGNAGRLVDPCDEQELSGAILEILTDPVLHRFYSKQGLQRSAEYKWADAARRTLSLYKTVLA